MNVFSIVNDTENKVKLVVDHRLYTEVKLVGFHPMKNDATTMISQDDLKKLVEISKHDPLVLNFAELATEAAEKPAAAPAKAKKQNKQKEEGKIEDAHQLGIGFKKHENMAKWYS